MCHSLSGCTYVNIHRAKVLVRGQQQPSTIIISSHIKIYNIILFVGFVKHRLYYYLSLTTFQNLSITLLDKGTRRITYIC